MILPILSVFRSRRKPNWVLVCPYFYRIVLLFCCLASQIPVPRYIFKSSLLLINHWGICTCFKFIPLICRQFYWNICIDFLFFCQNSLLWILMSKIFFKKEWTWAMAVLERNFKLMIVHFIKKFICGICIQVLFFNYFNLFILIPDVLLFFQPLQIIHFQPVWLTIQKPLSEKSKEEFWHYRECTAHFHWAFLQRGRLARQYPPHNPTGAC